MPKTRRRKLLVIALAIALPLLILVGRHYQSKWALAAFKTELRARGAHLDWRQLVPPAAAPEENGAGLFLTGAGSLNLRRITVSSAMKIIAPGRALVVVAPDDQSDLFFDSPVPPATNLNWTTITAELTQSAPSFQKIHAALQYPRFDHHLDFGRGFELLLPHLQSCRFAANWLALAAVADLRAGRSDAALTNLLDICTLIRRQKDEPIVISQLVRIACVPAALNVTWQTLQSPGWTDAQLAELQKSWQSLDFSAGMLTALEMEPAMVLVEFDRARADSKHLAQFLANAEKRLAGRTSSPPVAGSFLHDTWRTFDENAGRDFRRLFYPPLWKTFWADQEELLFLQRLQLFLGDARSALIRRAPGAGGAPASASSDSGTGRPDLRFPILALMMSDPDWMQQATAKALQAETLRELALTALALKRHQMRHGRNPENLAALVPEFLPQVPHDFMDGQPLRYRLTPDGNFLLYSVGPDGRDDGGDPTPARGDVGRNFSFENGRDLVWPAPATPADLAAFRKHWLKK